MGDLSVSSLAILLIARARHVGVLFRHHETALMSVNRYRLRHQAREGSAGARAAEKLLEAPDRLISTVQGTVDSVQSFGVFVALPSGINGVLPISQLPEDEARNVHNRFRSGMPSEARVLAVDPSRQRLTLTRRDDAEGDERAAFENYRAGGAATGGLGTLADLLKKRGG